MVADFEANPRFFLMSYKYRIIRLFSRKRILIPGLRSTLALLLLLFMQVSQAGAQGSYFWSQEQKIPEYRITTEEPPHLIADRNRTVHAFNSQPLVLNDPASPLAIFYRQWTVENGWTFPNDILFDPLGGSLQVLGTGYDQSGRVHLVFQKNGDIYYAQNYLENANNATTWLSPLYIAGNSEPYRSGVENIAAIEMDADGNEVVVIFSGQQSGPGLYFTRSSDGGNSWTEPYPIYLTGDDTVIVTDPKLYFGESGVFHAVWSTFLEDGSGGPGYYANFKPTLNAWSEPVELDVPGIRTPSVVEMNNTVIVSYYHNNVNGNWWRMSNDSGATWSLPEQISSRHVGTNGGVSFAVDGSNILHAFFGGRIDENNHGMWHVTFSGVTWINLEPVVRGPQIRERAGGQGFDPRSARAIIVNGNVALITWGTDGIAGTNGAWYSFKRLDAQELPSIMLESPTIEPRSTSVESVLAVESPELATPAEDRPLVGSPEPVPNQQTSLLIGVVPVALLLAGMIFIFYTFQKKHN